MEPLPKRREEVSNIPPFHNKCFLGECVNKRKDFTLFLANIPKKKFNKIHRLSNKVSVLHIRKEKRFYISDGTSKVN